MEDEAGNDEKILAVPIDDSFYVGVHSHHDLPPVLREQIGHFFLHYKDKDLEQGKMAQSLSLRGASEGEDFRKGGVRPVIPRPVESQEAS